MLFQLLHIPHYRWYEGIFPQSIMFLSPRYHKEFCSYIVQKHIIPIVRFELRNYLVIVSVVSAVQYIVVYVDIHLGTDKVIWFGKLLKLVSQLDVNFCKAPGGYNKKEIVMCNFNFSEVRVLRKISCADARKIPQHETVVFRMWIFFWFICSYPNLS